MKQHPITFLVGSDTPIFIGFNNRFIVAHNFYIQLVYNAGLLFLLGFCHSYLKLTREIIKASGLYRIDLIFIPLLAITFFVSDVGSFVYFIIYLSLNVRKPDIEKNGT